MNHINEQQGHYLLEDDLDLRLAEDDTESSICKVVQIPPGAVILDMHSGVSYYGPRAVLGAERIVIKAWGFTIKHAERRATAKLLKYYRDTKKAGDIWFVARITDIPEYFSLACRWTISFYEMHGRPITT